MRFRMLLSAVLVAGATTVLVPGTAEAAARISVTNERGTALADTRYATRLTLRGSGFQSIVNGHGGVYVFFGTVRPGWRPSQGGQTGRDYLYVPDTETKNNAGYQRYVAFPGSDTAGSAQAVMSRNGSWTAKITVPGARFTAVDRDGKPVAVDCSKVTCGLITIGAHGVKNARNESFTPVRFGTVFDAAPASPAPTAAAGGGSPATGSAVAPAAPAATPRPSGPPTAAVDGETAVVGRVMSFTGSGFTPGEQVTASLDAGRAAVGPLGAGTAGDVAGVIALPAGLRPGTHTLRLTGAVSGAKVDINFPVRADDTVAAAAEESSDDEGLPTWAGWTFLGIAVVLLLGAVGYAVRGVLRVRRETSGAV